MAAAHSVNPAVVAFAKQATGRENPALIAPLVGAAVGGGIGALSSKKNRLRNALLGAAAGGGLGSVAENAKPGLGLGMKYMVQDDVVDPLRRRLVSALGGANSVFGDIRRQMHTDAARAREQFEYGNRHQGNLPGLRDMEWLHRQLHGKKSSVREFGEKVADILPVVPGTPLATTPRDWATVAGGGGAVLGAGLGGLYGAFNPGKDEQGKRKSRLVAALKGALGGGALGGGVGAGVGYFSPETANKALQGVQSLLPIGKSPMDYKGRLGNIRNLFDANGHINKVQTDTREQFDLMADNPPMSVGRNGNGVPAQIERK